MEPIVPERSVGSWTQNLQCLSDTDAPPGPGVRSLLRAHYAWGPLSTAPEALAQGRLLRGLGPTLRPVPACLGTQPAPEEVQPVGPASAPAARWLSLHSPGEAARAPERGRKRWRPQPWRHAKPAAGKAAGRTASQRQGRRGAAVAASAGRVPKEATGRPLGNPEA